MRRVLPRRLGAFKRWARVFDRPTRSKGAARLWEASASHYSYLTPHQAAELLRDCGYVPFQGFPLVRSK